MVNWTKEQEQAIAARGSNLLVAAAAGSGKTAVLVERIIRLIMEDRMDIDRMLIVTFTHAAAGEMRERISGAIMAEMEKKNENEAHLRRQLKLLSRAAISTLHAFCMDVVRKHFHLIDMDPNFRIGDDTETTLLKWEALQESFAAAYDDHEAGFIRLGEMFGGNKDDTVLQELVLRCFEFIQSQPYPLQWLAEKTGMFDLQPEDLEQSQWVQVIKAQLNMELAGAKALFSEAYHLTEMPGGPDGYQKAIAADLEMVDDLTAALAQGLDQLYERLAGVKFTRLGRVGKEADEALKEAAKHLRDDGKKVITGIQTGILTRSPESYAQDLQEMAPAMQALNHLVNDFTARYQAQKLEKGLVDFNDLEHNALAILYDETVASGYREKFDAIFVDEYQDSNRVQETILSFIKRENNLFMVGDVKQSIYRFRLAEPALFLEKYETFDREANALNRRIDLSRNFRSRGEIIHGVNTIFQHIMSRSFGEIDYDEDAYLYQGLEEEEMDDPEVELHLLEKNAAQDEGEDALEELGDIEAEACMVAKRIKSLIGQPFYDAKQQVQREITYRDIVVLQRSTRNWAPTFLETLTAAGIPAYADVNTGYFEALEVNVFLNLLKVIDNKRQDIPLLSVMRSSIGKFTIRDLIEIRLHGPGKPFYEALAGYAANGSGELQERVQQFISRLNTWKEEARLDAIDTFIWKLLIDTGFYYYVGAAPGGKQRQANLRILLERAQQFQNTSLRGLFNFIQFVDQLQDSGNDLGTAKILGENDNVVRIMSIHKSKGLEFPVVIVAGMGKQFNLRDTSAPILLHKDLGIGPRYVNPDLRGYRDTIARLALKSQIKLESLAEEMRILYVACTRPKDKLILVGSVRNMARTAQKWAQDISAFNLARAKNTLDWVCPVIMRHSDGEALRELAAVSWGEDQVFEDDSRWQVTIWDRLQLEPETCHLKVTQEDFEKWLQDVVSQDGTGDDGCIASRFNWQYSHKDASQIPSKLSVTQLKQLQAKDLDSIRTRAASLVPSPKFMAEKKPLTAAQKGTVMHFVLQHLDFQRVSDVGEIQEQIDKMVKKELLLDEEAAAASARKIWSFFASNLGQRVLKAPKVYREVPFNLVRKACEVIDGLTQCEEDVLIQGVIDLYFVEGDELVLVDYKTDYICGENTKHDVLEKYRTQLLLYKEALERIQGKRVKESYLYLLSIGEAVEVR